MTSVTPALAIEGRSFFTVIYFRHLCHTCIGVTYSKHTICLSSALMESYKVVHGDRKSSMLCDNFAAGSQQLFRCEDEAGSFDRTPCTATSSLLVIARVSCDFGQWARATECHFNRWFIVSSYQREGSQVHSVIM